MDPGAGNGREATPPASAGADGLDSAAGAAFSRFEALVRTLRAGCPWDREQTHASLRRHLLEEAHETLEALDARAELDDSTADEALDTHLCEELGDLLYQVFFHAQVASERGSFAVSDVADAVHDKLVARHPHVFGPSVLGPLGPHASVDVEAADSAAVLGNWEKIKAAEKGRKSSMDGISAAQPALLYAQKTLERAASSGLDRQALGIDDAGADLAEAARRLRAAPPTASDSSSDRSQATAWDPQAEALGDLLFAAARLARQGDIDPESALRTAVQRFAAVVRAAESTEDP